MTTITHFRVLLSCNGKPWQKLILNVCSFMSAVLLLTGISTLAMPFLPLLSLLLICRFFQFLGYGIFLTADSILLVFTLGPERSRPYQQALHFFIRYALCSTFHVTKWFFDEVHNFYYLNHRSSVIAHYKRAVFPASGSCLGRSWCSRSCPRPERRCVAARRRPGTATTARGRAGGRRRRR